MLLRALRECINQFGYDLLDVYGRQNPKQKVEFLRENEENDSNQEGANFSKVEPAWYISILFDFFLKEFLPKYIGTYDYNFEFVCRFLIEFNKWLMENGLTRIKCSFTQ